MPRQALQRPRRGTCCACFPPFHIKWLPTEPVAFLELQWLSISLAISSHKGILSAPQAPANPHTQHTWFRHFWFLFSLVQFGTEFQLVIF